MNYGTLRERESEKFFSFLLLLLLIFDFCWFFLPQSCKKRKRTLMLSCTERLAESYSRAIVSILSVFLRKLVLANLYTKVMFNFLEGIQVLLCD